MKPKQSLFFVGLAVVLAFMVQSCYTPKRYAYTIHLAQSVPSNNVLYENDSLSVTFKVLPKYIELEMFNKMNEGMRVNWEQVMLSKNGFAQKTIVYQPGATKKRKITPAPFIPPQSRVQVGVIANSKIRFKRVYGKRTLFSKDNYPESDKGHKSINAFIQSLNGASISIFIPYYVKDNYQSKNFDLKLAVAEK
jgi:hypothetical protein